MLSLTNYELCLIHVSNISKHSNNMPSTLFTPSTINTINEA